LSLAVPLGVAALVSVSLLSNCEAAPARSTTNAIADARAANAEQRMHWWREAKFGMFIHWGLYSVPAGVYEGKKIDGAGEWIMNSAKIPVATYKSYAQEFDPTKFDADTWVSIAKAAGMKYIVMTAKHHEGFAMYHTTVDPFNIDQATQYHHDPIAEMAAACKRQHIKFGVYYSQAQDWNHPGGGAYGGHWDKAQDGDYDKYLSTVAVPQLRELLTRYHPAIIWFDTPVDMTPERAAPFVDLLEQNPNVIVNNRLGGGFQGDTETPEQNIPSTGFPGRDWETCMTINDTWGYKTFDTDFKSTVTLLTNLIDIASKGGNYLLNVGPDSTGTIPPPEVDRLEAIGKWLKVNGDAIYKTTASPYRRLPFDGRCTSKGNALYLEVFHWPDSGLTLPGVQTALKRASALATGQELTATKVADGSLQIQKPDVLDPIATVVKLEFASNPTVVEPEFVISPSSQGDYRLTADVADVHGTSARVEGSGPSNIGYWTDANDTVTWKLDVPTSAAGKYKVSVTYACQDDSAGSEYRVGVDGSDYVSGKVDPTGSWGNYKTVTLDDTITLGSGRQVLRVSPVSKPKYAVMNLREVVLTPSTGQ
jgi:alpha-L-fucosidase